MKIEECIGLGKENAITNSRLSNLTGLNDSNIMDKISIARSKRGIVILNDQDEKGYYIPTIVEFENAIKNLNSKVKNVKCILLTLSALKTWVIKNENNRK